MISGGMIAGGADGVAPVPPTPAPAFESSSPRSSFGVTTSPEAGDRFIAGTTLVQENVADRAHDVTLQKSGHDFQIDMKNMDYMSQFWSGLFNLAGQATRDIVQGIIANGYFNSQIKINDRQASAAEKTAEIQGEWLGRQAESFDEQNRLLYGPNGYARDRDRVQSQTAIAMNEAKERGKTERAALQGVDEAFGLDSRDSYGYGNPFAA